MSTLKESLPLALLLLTGAAGCSAEDPLAELDARYVSVQVELGVADRDTSRNVLNKEARRRKARAEKSRVAFFRDKHVQKVIDDVRKNADDPVNKVKAEGYWRHMIVSRPWTEDEKAEETRLIGKLEENFVQEAYWSPPDGANQIALSESWEEASREADFLSPELRTDLNQAWLNHRLGVVNNNLQDLVRLRNEVARREGFDNYWALSLASQGLTPAEVQSLIDELVEVVTPINQATLGKIQAAAAAKKLPLTFVNLPLLEREAGLEVGRDAADAFFDTDLAEERIMTAFQDMGISTDGWQVYTGPSRYVRPGVYGFPIRPPDHVAIVMSQDRRWSVWQYEALAHEGGHAVWWKSLGADAIGSPVLWEPESPWFEGFAQLFERLVYEPSFTARYLPELPAEERAGLAWWRASHMAGWITDSIVDTLVERRLYEDPTNLEAVSRFAAETRAKLTGLPTPDPADRGLVYDTSLGSSILWNYPAYAQNYLFAYMTETWLHDAVAAKVGGDLVANSQVGPVLSSAIIRAPATTPFPERLSALAPGERTAALKKYLKGPDDRPGAP